ncbi:MAG: hypothetical protein LW807_01835 [Proteobacteria bacterium]|jgi:hypothetical protein|nr:hypothetical protein [Pseudomonadota bacterium]
MIHPHQLADVAVINKEDANKKNTMCQVIDGMSEELWNENKKELNFKI